MFPLLVKFLTFANINNSFFVKNHNSLNLSYKVEENMFKNRNYTDEFFISEQSHFMIQNLTNSTDFLEDPLTEYILPIDFDWTKKNKVSSVKNQEQCGGCWAFSSSGAIESAWAIKHNILYDLSPQELIDCSSNYGNQGCEGGSMDLAFQYVMDKGLCLNMSYPYTSKDGICQKNQCKSVVKISNYSDIEQNNEKILKRVVYQQPVSVAIQANKRSFQLYHSGIYSDLECGTQLDHGVLLVGYGYDFNNNMDYWIIKNSWGPQWGENGYIRIQRNIEDSRGLCGIAMQPSIPIV
jgi:C1A family cysteine protease